MQDFILLLKKNLHYLKDKTMPWLIFRQNLITKIIKFNGPKHLFKTVEKLILNEHHTQNIYKKKLCCLGLQIYADF